MNKGDSCPFRVLGIDTDSSKNVILKAWRRAMRSVHSDRTGSADDEEAKRLNAAKDAALATLRDASTEKESKGRKGARMQKAFQEASGVEVEEETIDDIWKILTDQNEIANEKVELDEVAKEWLDKDKFKESMFGMMMRSLY